MEEDQEQKCHVSSFCKQSFSNGKQLGGHMRGHLALISASRKQGTDDNNNQEAINGDNGLDFDEDGDEIIKKSQQEMGVDQDYGANGHVVGGNPKRGLFGVISASRKQGSGENGEEAINGEKGLDFDDDGDETIKKIQQKMGVGQDYGSSGYVTREKPKRSSRVSNPSKDYDNLCKQCGKGFHSSRALATHMRSHSFKRKEPIKKTVCEKCGKGFDSVKALYGHMRCHSTKRSRPSDESSRAPSPLPSSEEDDDGGAAGELANPIRKKRSCTRYKSEKLNDLFTCTGLSSSDDEVEGGAMCLMMLSRALRSLDGVKLVISNQAEFACSDSGHSRSLEKNVEFEVSVDGSTGFCKFKNKSELGLKKDLVTESGSGQANMGMARCKSTKKSSRSYGQDFGNRGATDSETSVELKRRSKDNKCPICYKEFGSAKALGGHKRVHYKTESRGMESNDFLPDIHRLVDLNLDGGINNGDVEFNPKWVQNIGWHPPMTLN